MRQLLLLALVLGCGPSALEKRTARMQAKVPERATKLVGTPVPLRIYVDEDYRKLVVDWRARIHAMIERANSRMALLNAHFTVLELAEWPAGGHAGLSAALGKLRKSHPETGEATVLGFVGRLAGYTSDVRLLGTAAHPGHHMVIRAAVDPRQGTTWEGDLRDDNREHHALFRATRQHIEVVLLLHEWAHTRGALHVQRAEFLMHPTISEETRFSPENEAILRAGLAVPPAERRAAILEAVKANPSEDYSGGDWQGLLDRLMGRKKTAPKRVEVELPPMPDGYSRARFKEAHRLLNTGDVAGARKTLRSLLQRYPGLGPLYAFRCRLAEAEGRPPPPEGCVPPKAAGAALADPDPEKAALHLASGRRAEGVAELERLHAKLLASGRSARPKELERLARLWTQANELTRAEQVLKRSGAAHETLRQRLQSLRRRYGVAGVPPDKEGAYLTGLRDAMSRRRARAKFILRFPETAGATLLRALGEPRPKEARALVDRAVELDPEYIEAYLHKARLAEAAGETSVARRSLEKALRLDETRSSSWLALAKLYRRQGQLAALQGLQNEHEARFSRPLEP